MAGNESCGVTKGYEQKKRKEKERVRSKKGGETVHYPPDEERGSLRAARTRLKATCH